MFQKFKIKIRTWKFAKANKQKNKQTKKQTNKQTDLFLCTYIKEGVAKLNKKVRL